MRIKICGITRPEDAVAAEEAGADAVGFVFVPSSKRYLTVERAREVARALGPLILRVGVFVDEPLERVLEAVRRVPLGAVQLHGQESADYAAALREEVLVIKAVSFTPEMDWASLRDYPADALLLDGLKPGSGEAFDWEAAATFRAFPRLILAGGLTPKTVAGGIEALQPYGVDVSSGVETSPGMKSAGKIQDFVRAARAAALSTVIHRQASTCG